MSCKVLANKHLAASYPSINLRYTFLRSAIKQISRRDLSAQEKKVIPKLLGWGESANDMLFVVAR